MTKAPSDHARAPTERPRPGGPFGAQSASAPLIRKPSSADERARHRRSGRRHRQHRSQRRPRRPQRDRQERQSSALSRLMFWRLTDCVVPEDRDDDRQADRGLGGGDGHHEEDEHLAVDAVAAWASATNVRFTALSISSTHMKTMIAFRRISTPSDADGEQDRGDQQGGPEQHGQTFRLARTTAPTIAASSSTRGDLERHQVLREQRPATAPTTPCAAAASRPRTGETTDGSVRAAPASSRASRPASSAEHQQFRQRRPRHRADHPAPGPRMSRGRRARG